MERDFLPVKNGILFSLMKFNFSFGVLYPHFWREIILSNLVTKDILLTEIYIHLYVKSHEEQGRGTIS